jgi:hypothetical protein
VFNAHFSELSRGRHRVKVPQTPWQVQRARGI